MTTVFWDSTGVILVEFMEEVSIEGAHRMLIIHLRRGGENHCDNMAEHARTGFLPRGNIKTHPMKGQVPKSIWRLSKNNLLNGLSGGCIGCMK